MPEELVNRKHEMRIKDKYMLFVFTDEEITFREIGKRTYKLLRKIHHKWDLSRNKTISENICSILSCTRRSLKVFDNCFAKFM